MSMLKLSNIGLLLLTLRFAYAELPPIQMPEYVIEGIERAVQIKAEKISSAVEAESSQPGEVARPRPDLGFEFSDQPPSRPGLFAPFGQGYLKVKAGLGMFSQAELGLDYAKRTAEIEFVINGDGESMPRRTAVGARFRASTDGGLARHIGESQSSEKGLFSPRLTLATKAYRRYRYFDELQSIDLDNLNLSLTIAPAPARLGTFVGRAAFQPWNYADMSFTQSEMRLNHSLSTALGRIESNFFISGEVGSRDRKALQLTALDFAVYRRYNEDFSYYFGGTAWTGYAPQRWTIYILGNAELQETSQPRNGLKPWLGITWRAPFGGALTAAYKPQTALNSLRNELEHFPYEIAYRRGSIIEGVSDWTVNFARDINPKLTIDCAFNWRNELHTFCPYYASGVNWLLIDRRTKTAEWKVKAESEPLRNLGLSIWGIARTVKTSGLATGSRSPLTPKLSAGLESTVLWHRWTLFNSIVWEDKAALKFDGDATIPSRLVWDSALRMNINPSLDAGLEILNLLDRHNYTYPRFDDVPLTVTLSAQYRLW